MTQNFSQNTVQSALGYYFKTPNLLSAAFTHVSASDTENNEGLIFLGEKLFDFVISDYVFSRFPFSVEKQLSGRLNDFKKALNFQSFISDKGLTRYIDLSASNEKLRDDRRIHGDIFLAILAAIYKDGGLPSLKAFILPLLRATDNDEHYQPKGATESDAKGGTVAEAARIARLDTASEIQKSLKPEAKSEKPESDKSRNSRHKLKSENKGLSDIGLTLKSQKDIKNEKISEEKAEEKPSKKGVNLLKAIILPSKNRKKDEKPVTSDMTEEKEEPSVKNEPKRSFIRDALAPVSLPESMRNPKPRRPYKTTEEPVSSDRHPSNASSFSQKQDNASSFEKNNINDDYTDDSENYKSLLQEYVQKNIRSANVLIRYNTARVDNTFVTEISLDGKTLAKADGSTKKLAEKSAAKLAYSEISDSESNLYSWFASLSEQGIASQKSTGNYISRLNEYYQKKAHVSAAPLTYEPRPSGEKKSFSVAIMFNGEELAVGTAHTVKDAKQAAAKKVCEKLKI